MFWTVFGAVLGFFCALVAFALLFLCGLWAYFWLDEWWQENYLRFRKRK